MMLKEITYRLYFVALSVLAMVALVACGSKEAEMLPDEPTYTMRLQITTDGIFSRAGEEGFDWGDNYNNDAGTAFDNSVSALDLFLVGENNTLVPLYAIDQRVDGKKLYVVEVDEKTPGVTIDKTTLQGSFSGKIMAVANVTDSESAWLGQDNWEDVKMPYDNKFGISDNWRIPMWGVESFTDVALEPNKITYLGEIPMLRAVSKIIIKLHSSISDDYEIEKISMAEGSPLLYSQGYNLPNGALKDGVLVESTKKLSLTGCLDVRDDATEIENLKFKVDKNGTWFTYVSESATDTDKPFAFNVTLKSKHDDRPPFSGTLYLSNYSPDGTQRLDVYTNVVRNHEYEFTIRLAELQFLTTVKKWEFGGKVHIEM